MWTAKEIARALRGEKASILTTWRTAAGAKLWHLDSRLFERKGHATLCATETLAALLTYHTGKNALAPLPADVPEEEQPCETDDTELALVAQAALAPLSPTLAPLVASGTCWLELPISLADLHILMELLSQTVRESLAGRNADQETQDFNESLLQTTVASTFGQRCVRAEQELAAHREEVAVSQHMESRFLGNASHDLRTPLTAVLGFSELLLEETYGELNEPQAAAVGHIENSARNLLEIVNNLLDLLHIRAGKFDLQYHRIALATLMQSLHAILLPLANRKKVAFHLVLLGEPGTIEADENILRHIVYHLLSSSLRATPENGSVTLRVERDDHNLHLIAEDTAVHLPPDAIANMMAPFPRLENSSARGYEGWEVGLPLVRRYIELHNGKMEIESLPESGTVFRIALPLQRPA